MADPIGKRANVASWILSVLLALAFAASGIGKLLGQQAMVDNFARWGFPRWFVPVTGACELAGAILIAIPRTRAFGGAPCSRISRTGKRRWRRFRRSSACSRASSRG